MNILILNWKDIKNPQAGGAEVVIHELAKRLINDNNKVTLLTSRFQKSRKFENLDGVGVIRIGNQKYNRYSHPFAAIRYYENNFKGKFDLIIECVNTAPYLINLFKDKEQVILFYHQLAREIWFYETKFPLNWIGYLLEPIYTYFQSRFRNKVITVSKSTKADLVKYGFNPKLVKVITQGTNLNTRHPNPEFIEGEGSRVILHPNKSGFRMTKKTSDDNRFHKPTSYILYLGSLRAMKRPIHVLRAFQIVNRQLLNVNCLIAGSGPKEEVTKLKKFIKENRLLNKVGLLGRVDEKKKIELMQNAFVLIVPSLKEGWGLIVTEAAKLGTPSIVYNVDGLRDSVKHGKTGYVVENNDPEALADKISYLYKNPKGYLKLCENCIKLSKHNTFDNSYSDFKSIIS